MLADPGPGMRFADIKDGEIDIGMACNQLRHPAPALKQRARHTAMIRQADQQTSPINRISLPRNHFLRLNIVQQARHRRWVAHCHCRQGPRTAPVRLPKKQQNRPFLGSYHMPCRPKPPLQVFADQKTTSVDPVMRQGATFGGQQNDPDPVVPPR
jgi:hypothetical protein